MDCPWCFGLKGTIVGVVRRLAQRSDQEIQAEITEELNKSPGIVAASVEVTVNRGVVKLSGRVSSVPEKLMARRAAMRVKGVRALADEMAVLAPSSLQ